MPNEYPLYNPIPLKVGEVPTTAARVCPYVFPDYTLVLGVLTYIGNEKRVDNNGREYYDCAQEIFKPTPGQKRADPRSVGNPVATELNAWRYYPRFKMPNGEEIACVVWCPCGPPDPTLQCPPH